MRGWRGSVYTFALIFFSWIVLLSACKSNKSKTNELRDTKDSGKIYVSADESFKPVIDAQVQVYESNHPGTNIIVNYKPEAECLKDFATDSIRMIIATRPYSENEREFMADSMDISPDYMVVAKDAVAVIINPGLTDSIFTMTELKEILTGRFKKNLIPVFDGVQATSTVRYIVDSVLRNDTLTSKALAARSSEGVIDYVAIHPDAIGFIGVSWIGNKDDPDQQSFLKKVKIARLESTDDPGEFIAPVQMNIYRGRYPLIRDLVYILKENYKGLGHGFAGFMSGEIGQLIFKRAYLRPVLQNFIIRSYQLQE
jgi:ABC-type phosphate transport system substrate-binding protein